VAKRTDIPTVTLSSYTKRIFTIFDNIGNFGLAVMKIQVPASQEWRQKLS